jgi:2-polyprenyl-6-methoxyphenol hydroxylase-like FAD-dependent oxidoreductase
LTKHALANGFKIRYNTSFTHFEEEAHDRIISTVKDGLTNTSYQIRSKYLFGADGARSRIQKQLDLPLVAKPMKGLAINVLVKADLTQHIHSRMGNLHFVLQPDRPHPTFGWLSIARMVKPWHEWIFILFPGPDAEAKMANTAHADYAEHISNLIGDQSISVDVLGVSKWYINEIAAEKYSKGNM